MDDLAIILGSTKIRRYVFMVPRFDARLLEHCGKQCTKMRERRLGILDGEFDILVHTEDNYPSERAQLIELALRPLQLDVVQIPLTSRTEWEAANVPLVTALTTKIATFQLAPEQQDELRDELLGHYLQREQLLEQVLNEAPEIYARLQARIRNRERLLATARLIGNETPREHAKGVIQELSRELLEESKALQLPAAEALAYGTAADWLARCPLNFSR